MNVIKGQFGDFKTIFEVVWEEYDYNVRNDSVLKKGQDNLIGVPYLILRRCFWALVMNVFILCDLLWVNNQCPISSPALGQQRLCVRANDGGRCLGEDLGGATQHDRAPGTS